VTVESFSNVSGIVAALRRSLKNLVPPPELRPSQWAESNVVIPVGNAIPGQINFDNAPHQREPLDMIVHPGCRRVSLMFGAQTGKTTVIQCGSGYFIAHEPRSQIMVQPSQGDMQTFMETKLRPMFDANPAISEKMAKQRGRDGVNNSRIISYIGGWMMFSWAGSPKTLRGRSAPVNFADEIDGMETTTEGDPVQLLVQRSATFGDQRMLIESSTPTIKGESRIESAYEQGDKRRFFVPCPDCGEHQFFKWAQVIWTGRDAPEGEQDPESARYTCEHCGSLWDDGQRMAAIRAGEWRAEKPFKGHASFHLPEMASTFRRLRDIVQSYLDKLAVGDTQSFINVSLAETYEETGEKADPDSLMARRETYAAPVPMGGLFLAAGIDAQGDRLEVEIKAYGLGEESFNVDYRVLWGDPLAPDVWRDLDDLLEETFLHESGHYLRIDGACLDTGGTKSYTQTAYDWLRGKTGRRIFGVKGIGGWGRGIVEKVQRKQSGKNARKIDLFLVGVDEAKLVIMRRLALKKVGPGYMHFPQAREKDYFDQLTAEKLVTRYVKGFPVREWHKPDRARNEALDTNVYSYAAFKIVQPNLKRLAERLNVKTVKPAPEPVPVAEVTAETPVENHFQKVAETAVNMVETLQNPQKMAEIAQKIEEKQPENRQVEPSPAPQQNPVVSGRRKLKAGGGVKRRNFAKQW
jgi:phage terminase large subunit GpA-like protein